MSSTTNIKSSITPTMNLTSTGSLVFGSSGISTGTSGFGLAGASSVTPTKRRGWPQRHMRRCWWYFRLIRNTFHLNIPENDDRLYKIDPLNNPKYWTEHEIEVLTRIRKELADLYNNRYIEYKKMIAAEKGYELPEMVNTNKFIMK